MVTEIRRVNNGAFRYYGKIRLGSPVRYGGREVSLFIISHERDVRDFLGKTISLTYEDDLLIASIEAKSDPFSVSQPEPHLAMELTDGKFAMLDYSRFEKPIAASGIIRSYRPQQNDDEMYFMYDEGYSGDLASVEITKPADYRGVLIHVVVPRQHDAFAERERRTFWSNVGRRIEFSVSESTLAWEPFGFVPVKQLQPVTIESAP